MDFVLALWDCGTPRLRVVEAKASRKDRTYQRIQLGVYVLMLQQMLRGAPLVIAGRELGPDAIEGCVARIDETTNEPQRILELSALNLESEFSDIGRLLASDGLLASIADHDLESLDFRLNQKCDSCVFSVHCFPESARRRRLELIGISPATCRALQGGQSFEGQTVSAPGGVAVGRDNTGPITIGPPPGDQGNRFCLT